MPQTSQEGKKKAEDIQYQENEDDKEKDKECTIDQAKKQL